MLTVLSLVTSVKDYIEIAHKLIESQSGNFFFPQPYIDMVGVQNAAALNLDKQTGGASMFAFNNYTELGAVLTYIVLSVKEFLTSFFSFTWLSQIWSLPLIVPDIASAMISEVSVLDSYFTNAFSFLETGLSTSSLNVTELKSVTTENTFVYAFEKFITGFINSLFLVLPTSTAHLITLRRFVIQGLEAGYIAGLGTIAGNVLWLASIILGWRFIVIPWLSFDIFRYILGFSLLVKYLWDSSKEFNKTSAAAKLKPTTFLEDNTKKNIFVLNFLLALTEQTSIYPFISNISFGPEGSILESFSGTISQSYTPNVLNAVGINSVEFLTIHGCYLLGIVLGCFSLLQFTVWFWENPAFSIYMWMITSYRVTTSSYYKVLNFVFLYLTMLCAISSIPYFGLDYTLTNPLGLIPQDRIIYQKFTTANGPSDKILQETAFLGVNPTDKNTRIRDGMHARRERWKERLIKYQAFDASLYDQGTYDILTIEDLNYGFERFWLRRKLRNHQIRFRLFPGPWMRSLKKQLNKPGFSGPRVEFFRILFEQYYHPIFHRAERNSKVTTISNNNKTSNSESYAELANSNRQKSLFLTSSSPTTNTELANSSSLIQETFSKNLETNLTGMASGHERINVNNKLKLKKGLVGSSVAQTSALRKFSRNFNNRLNSSLNVRNFKATLEGNFENSKPVYSKSLKYLFNKITNPRSANEYPKEKINLFRNISRNMLLSQTAGETSNSGALNILVRSAAKPYNILWSNKTQNGGSFYRTDWSSLKKTNIRKKLSKKERVLLTLKAAMQNPNTALSAYPASGHNLTKAIRGRPFGASLEPLKYYLQKDEALKRKFKYYSTTVSRNLSVGNNAPYFKTMLKRAFYYHKPSLRWKRTMFTATMRRGFRKKSSSPKKLAGGIAYPSSTLTLDATNPSSKNVNTESPGVFYNQAAALQNPIYTKTASYSVLGKRASRYRYQIYKDVLQHWYYSPFNRLLLKFDIDSFINRQPKNHFLTKKEERLLHLRRVLLSEHYNSLRWYTYMQHYNTMKSQIGSTKSFSSTVYKQQFQGTFKKIRHLFAITPSQGDMPVLQFDQPLYTELNRSLPANTSSVSGRSISSSEGPTALSQTQNGPAGQRSFGDSKFTKFNLLPIYLHEDLQTNSGVNMSTTLLASSTQAEKPLNTLPEDLIEQSVNLTGQYIQNNASGDYALSTVGINAQALQQATLLISNKTLNQSNPSYTKEILLRLLKECKRRVNDQVFLKNYITHRLDKREQRNNEVQNELKKNLESFQNWLSPISITNLSFGRRPNSKIQNKLGLTSIQTETGYKDAFKDSFNTIAQSDALLMQTTGVRKALNEGVFALNNINPATSMKTLLTKETNLLKYAAYNRSSAQSKLRNFQRSFEKQNYYIEALSTLEKEEQIKQTLKSIKSLTANNSSFKASLSSGVFKPFSATLRNQTLSTLGAYKSFLAPKVRKLATVLLKRTNILSARTEKSIEWWRQKQRVMTKRKSSRKKARFKNIKASVEQNAKAKPTFSFDLLGQNQLLNYQIPEGSLLSSTLRKKRNSVSPEALITSSVESAGVTTDGSQASILDARIAGQSLIPDSRTSAQSLQKEKQLTYARSAQLLKNVFLKKFNSKRSSKGSRYRYMSNSRGFAYVRRPKNASGALNNLFDASTGGINTADLMSSGTNKFISKQKKLVLFKTALGVADKKIIGTDGAYETKLASRLGEQNSTIINASTKENLLAIKKLLVKDYIKKSPIQKRSKRAWKKRKRHKLTRNHYKYRKRNIHGFGKLRNLNKKFKRIKDIQELQNWWWNVYLPRYAHNYIKNSNILLSKAGVDKASVNAAVAGTATETGILKKEQAYKPLSTNKALEIREKLLKSSSLQQNLQQSVQQKSQSFQTQLAELTEAPIVSFDSTRERVENNPQTSFSVSAAGANKALNVLDQIYAGMEATLLESKNGNAGSYAERSLQGIRETSLSNAQNQWGLGGFLKEAGYSSFVPSAEAQTLPQTYNTTNIPFYAGWDESLRKFVVTNRLLSRRDAGFRANLTNNYGREPQSATVFDTTGNLESGAFVEFTKAPIQGLNEGSFLYLQTEMPFNSYIIDQFIPTNQSFYAPLGWKRFQFRHSLLKNWQNFTKSSITNSNNGFAADQNKQVSSIYKCSANKCAEPTSVFVKHTSLLKYLNMRQRSFEAQSNSTGYAQRSLQGITENKTLKILQNKRIKKRYKLLKQTPIQLMYVPTGALLNEVLPSHYVSVFDKQYRIPRNRYLKRYLPKPHIGTQSSNLYGSSSFDGQRSLEGIKENLTQKSTENRIKDLTILEYSNNLANFGKLNTSTRDRVDTPLDFTLRKKVKPRRKYHKKRFTKKDGLIFPRRQKFSYIVSGQQQLNSNAETNMQEFFRLRPSTKAKQTSYGTGAFTKSKSKKRLAKPVRLRQLRNREFKQVYKPLQRFQPRSGGFVWPGDYLRFEIVPMPKLNSLKATISTSYGTLEANQATTSAGVYGSKGLSPKAKTKRKINVQPVGLLPRKYLIEKHNLKVLKKKISLSSLNNF
jgi:hypothetical protein